MSKATESKAAVTARLRDAIGAWGYPTGAFLDAVAKEMEEGRGSSRFQLLRYVKGEGKYPPPLHFLEAAARVLGVRVGWLAFGEGERTEAEEARRRRMPEEPHEAELLEGIKPYYPQIENADWRDRASLLRTASEIHEVRAELSPQQVGAMVGQALRYPLIPFGLEQAMDAQVSAAYLPSMVHALNALLGAYRMQAVKSDLWSARYTAGAVAEFALGRRDVPPELREKLKAIRDAAPLDELPAAPPAADAHSPSEGEDIIQTVFGGEGDDDLLPDPGEVDDA